MRSSPRPPLPEGPYLVVGLARSGLAAARALRARGERAIGVDAGTPDGLQELRDAGVELYLREGGVALLERVGAVIKSPGVPREAPVIAKALARGMPVLGELELGWRLLSNEVIAVTGTNGKTTSVELIGHIHREAGLAVAVAGNVGAALSGFAGRIDPDVTVVCEASSFQLQDTEAFAPEAAVLLNIAPDHLDRHGTMEAYAQAKLQIFARQSPEDIAVVPAKLSLDFDPPPNLAVDHPSTFSSNPPANLAVDPRLGVARRVRFGDDPAADLCERDGRLWWREGDDDGDPLPLLAVGELRLRGRHNVQNAMAAAAVCLARGVDVDAVRAGLRTFAGVAHRLEEVARRDGVVYVNDSKATNVASALVALDSFPDGVVHLILGGQAKGQDFSALRDPVERGCRAVYLIGEDAPSIAAALAGANVPVRECGDLEHALKAAAEAARAGEVILLSPACASFDQFADYEARGERFRELVLAGA
jgi:UDP-N-acetylmuramoylalanine--D-glutamate ligase